MLKKLPVSTILVFLLLGLMFASFPGNLASAKNTNEAIESPYTRPLISELPSVNQVGGGPGYIVLNAFDFVPNNWSQPPAFDGTFLYNPSSTDWAGFTAPAHLPDGAVINKMVVYYLDNLDPFLDLWVWLQECPLGLSVCTTVISGVSAHGDPNFRIMEAYPGVPAAVDLQSNSYLVQISVPNGGETIGITGIRIDYGYPTMLPLIQR